MMTKWLSADNRAGWLVSLLLALLILFPLLAVIVQAVLPGVFIGSWRLGQFDVLLEVFRRPLWYRSLINSILLSCGTAALGTLLGAGLAVFRSQYVFPTAGWLDAAAWILLITPSFIMAQGWVLFASANGIAATWLHLPFVTSYLFHPAGLVFIMILSKFPLAYLAVRSAIEWKVESLSLAARLAGASRLRTWLAVELPLLSPAIGSGAMLVFMDTIGDFGLPATISAVYRFPTLPYSIYTAIYTSPIRFDMAGALSFYLVLIVFAAIVIQFYFVRRSRYDHMTAMAVRFAATPLSSSKARLAAAGTLAFLSVAIGIPIGSTVLISAVHSVSDGWALSNWTLANYGALLDGRSLFLSSLLRSLNIAVSAALIGALIGILVSYVLVFTSYFYKHVVEMMSLAALAVPGVVLGIGYIFAWNQKWLEPFGLLLYGKSPILVVAGVAGAIPMITRIMTGTMASVPRSMLDAAQLQGISFAGRIVKILLPLCRGALLTAALTAFGTSMFDLATNAILFPPGYITLPVMINKAYEAMDFGQASAATLLGGGIVTAIIVLIGKLVNTMTRRGAKD